MSESKKKNTPAKKNQLFLIKEDNELLKFLYQNLGKSNKIKSLLKNKFVSVNGVLSTQFNQELKEGDKVEIQYETSTEEKRFRDISIVYEDNDIIVIDKHAGLLSISTAKENKKTAFRILSNYVKKEDPANLIFVVHRLDRETSGLMMFAKSIKVKELLQENWNEVVTERSYLALVEGKPEPWSDSITSYLRESKSLIVHSSQNPEKGQLAVTHYKMFKSKKEFALLKVWLETGRKNQIRVHMNQIGHPIIGDKKYGSKLDLVGRLCLHAWVLSFKHPITGELLEFKTAIPRKFSRIV